ncbi:hypothetical protein NP233_g10971 [Leucocoprinus birnbaumii]|uniref:Nephrocystin 3-like N-terminal domain-containing protein n=1 Tax=Leucocoprinus birnbaumii TaxID=56174 RepID=A0AAD5YRD9_9AGAR|nr:hypothetical protein NP233_g10971 [Leucocoprinus birnbaumii]
MNRITAYIKAKFKRKHKQSHGSFAEAHHFTIQSSSLYDIGIQNNHYYGGQTDGIYISPILKEYVTLNPSVLHVLAKEAMLDAAFDAAARDPPPKCHPGTRTTIIQSVQEVLCNPRYGALLIYINGPAGVGKSAIIQHLAETQDANHNLGGSIFFSRPNGRNNPKKVFTTLSYQLAVNKPAYRHYITQKIVENPGFTNKTIDKQFEHLILIPLAQRGIIPNSESMVIFLDGLDELQDERDQVRIVDIINNFVLQYPSLPVIWVIASRPEPHITQAMLRAKNVLSGQYRGYHIPVDSEEGVRDVEHFLHSEFTRIRRSFPSIMTSEQVWPLEHQFLMISNTSSGHFAFASTAIKYIDDPSYGNPVSRLNLIISILQKQSPRRGNGRHPFQALDVIYAQIMADIPGEVLLTTRNILSYIAVLNRIGDQESTLVTCNILGLEQHEFYGSLQKLYSVLAFPEPREAMTRPIRFLHTSFLDYLENLDASSPFKLDLDETATRTWRRCMGIIQPMRWGENAIVQSLKLSWPSNEESARSFDLVPGNHSGKRVWLKAEGMLSSAILERITSDVQISASRRWPNLLFESFAANPQFRINLPVRELASDVEGLDFSRSMTNRSFLWNSFSPNEWFEFAGSCPVLIREKMIHQCSVASLDRERIRMSLSKRGWFISGFRRIVGTLHAIPFTDSSGVLIEVLLFVSL